MSNSKIESVGISIVNYKTANLTIECLNSLAKERQFVSFKVIVVDNDSQDGSYEKITETITKNAWSDWVEVVASGGNGGFSYGNNIAIRKFLSQTNSPRFIYLLNSDAFVRKNAIQELVSFLETHPKVGIVGSRLENLDGSPRNTCFQFHNFLTELNRGFSLSILSKLLDKWVIVNSNPKVATKTDWVSGASMMIRISLFHDIGLMDESYFLYYEEMDFCLQANRAGWECWYVPKSRVVHFAGQSSGVNNKNFKPKRRPQYWFNSRRRYFLKNFGPMHTILADLFWLTGCASWRLRNIFQRKKHNYPPCFLYDSLINSVFIRGFKQLPTKNK